MDKVLLDIAALTTRPASSLIVTFFIIILLFGCATPTYKIYEPPQKPTNIPSLNLAVDSELGDTLIAQGTLKEYDAIRLLSPVIHESPTHTLSSQKESSPNVSVIPAGLLVKKATILNSKFNGALYVSEQYTLKNNNQLLENYNGGILLAENDKFASVICAWPNDYIGSIDCANLSSGIKYTHDVKHEWNEGYFLRELIYNGRAGDQVKFIYREFSGGIARDAFNQHVTYDLAIGDTIGFKGARFRILKADNISIKYEVLKHFK